MVRSGTPLFPTTPPPGILEVSEFANLKDPKLVSRRWDYFLRYASAPSRLLIAQAIFA